MSSHKKGFLMSDACICVFIVSICALIASSIVQIHFHTTEVLHQKEVEMEEEMEEKIERTEQCPVCTEAPPSLKS